MRIIAGEFRGRTLRAPKGEGTRPTTDRVREALMSVIHSARGGFEGASVLDAFAGSGALGLEALSRGAQKAVFYELAPEALRALQANVAAIGLDAKRAVVRRSDVLERPPAYARPPFDIVFLDPPYAYCAKDVLGMAAGLRERGALAPQAIVVYEHAAGDTASVHDAAADSGFSVAQSKKYGDTVLDILISSPHQGQAAGGSEE